MLYSAMTCSSRYYLRTCFLLLAMCGTVSTASARLANDVVPVKQSIHLTVDADTTDYSGSVDIALNVRNETSSFVFHAREMELTSVTLSGQGGEIEISIESGEHGERILTTSSPLSPGDYSLKIEFTNEFNTQAVSLYRVISDEAGYLFTQFEDTDARGAFPCFDEPIFKIPFAMTLTLPVGHIAISNTPIREETIHGEWKDVVFVETKPLPTYLLAIATGTLEIVDVPNMTVPTRMVTVKGKSGLTKLAASMTPPILSSLEEYFGQPYPYKKLDLIAVPEFWAGAMENAGAITFRQTLLVVDEATASDSRKRRMASVIAHELAHMWFGDLVTMEWWDDLWLNESFASWMATKSIQSIYPEYHMPIRRVRRALRVMGSDARKSTMPIRMPTEDTENLLANIGIIYSKGEAVLGMFESYIGEEKFRAGVNQYLSKHKWGNAVASDLWTELAEASGVDAEAALKTFIEQPGVPLVRVEIGSDGEVTLTQSRFGNYGSDFSDAPLWQIPIILKYGVGDKAQTFSYLLKDKSATIRLPGEAAPEWLLPNGGMSGYYRWNLQPEMLLTLANRSGEVLTVSERIGIIGNLSGLLDAGMITGVDFLKALSGFSSDPDPEVISAIASELGGIKLQFITDDLQLAFAVFVRKTLNPAMNRFGLEKTDGEAVAISIVRPSLIGLLADEGRDETVLKFARKQASAYMKDVASVDPALAGTCIGLAAVGGDAELYDEYLRRFEEATVPVERSRFLRALGQFRDSSLVERSLQYTLDGPLRPQERRSIPGAIASQSPKMGDRVLEWIIQNWDTLVAYIPPLSRPRMVFFARGCSHQRLAKAKAFFSDPERTSKGMEIQLARVTESVNDCIGLREREGEAVAEYLTKLYAESN